MPRLTRDGRSVPPLLRSLDLAIEVWRVPDRASGAFGQGRRTRLPSPGRPSCLYGNVLVSLSRVEAMEGKRS
jgi:hypothetical protein